MTTADPTTRIAAVLVIVVGVLNLVLGLVSLLTDQIRLSDGIAGGLVVAGLVTAAVGTLVWRANRLATVAALTVFTMLLVYQLSEVAAGGGDTAGALASQPTARLAVLAVLVLVLSVAAWRQRGQRW
ncbi:MAG: hypothetical protein WD010_05630 [Nitriliruptor sp.]|uniref:hypothetical protein n=1 Tax=Nitriliruptor sp. TaxID=2448056 RepID=UPI0034A041E0